MKLILNTSLKTRNQVLEHLRKHTYTSKITNEGLLRSEECLSNEFGEMSFSEGRAVVVILSTLRISAQHAAEILEELIRQKIVLESKDLP